VPGRSKETNAGNGVRRNFVAEKHLEREQNSDSAGNHFYSNILFIIIKVKLS
tara:strand:+ start:312 stop:467 length:156 start_codon:yes stop_codon:yes gene_type:complete